MAQPNYKLRNDHVATIGHMRQERERNDQQYATKANTYTKTEVAEEIKKISLDELESCKNSYNMFGNKLIDLGLGTSPGDSVNMSQLNSKANLSDVYTKTQVDTALSGKKNTGTFDNKIQNSSGNSAISCDSDRYISVKSNGNKIADLLADEVNDGLTIATNNRRFNVVSTQPQTHYVNSTGALHNFKYTDDGNLVAGQARFGQIQLAPSNTTNLNPGLTLASSRVNGLGTVGAVFLDSTYGQTNDVPLALAAQSLTDSGASSLTMYKASSTQPIKNQFTHKTGYASGVVVDQPNQFTSKSYVDAAVSGSTPDLSSRVAKAGDTMTGALILSGNPTQNLQAATKQYVDSQVSGAGTGDFKADGSVAMSGNLNLANNKIINSLAPLNGGDLTNKTYVDAEVSNVQGQIDGKIDQTTADTLYLPKIGTVIPGGNLDMGNNYKVVKLADATAATDAMNRQSSDVRYYQKIPLDLINLPQGNVSLNSFKITSLANAETGTDCLNQNSGDARYYLKTTTLNNIVVPNGNVSMNGQKITDVQQPTHNTDVATKSYVDSVASLASTQLVSPDGQKSTAQTNSALEVRNAGVTHTSVLQGQIMHDQQSYFLNSQRSSATFNSVTFRNSVVSTIPAFQVVGFTDIGNKKVRLTGSISGLSDVYLDLDLTSAQIQIPEFVKLMRTDTATNNFSAQEYITKAYADANISTTGFATTGDVEGLQDQIDALSNPAKITTALGYEVQANPSQITLLDITAGPGNEKQFKSFKLNGGTIVSETLASYVTQKIDNFLGSSASNQMAWSEAGVGKTFTITGNSTATTLSQGVESNLRFYRSTPSGKCATSFNQRAGYESDMGDPFLIPNAIPCMRDIYPYMTLSFFINIGDHPSTIETSGSQRNFITSFTYTNLSSTSSKIQCNVDYGLLNNTMGWTNGFDVVYGFRSLRGSTVTQDNDVLTPITSEYVYQPSAQGASYFTLYMEDFSASTNNIAIVGHIFARA